MNILISNHDYFKVIRKSLIADYDIEILTLLYQPIISSNAMSLYLTLLSESKYQEWIEINTHEELIKLTSLNMLQINEARNKLEGIGLLKTYRKINKNETSSYVYELYAPKTPDAFFKDPIFYGLLEASVGEKKTARLKRIFKQNNIDVNDYVNISTPYNNVYGELNIKFNDDKQLLLKRSITPIKGEFDCLKFKNIMEEKYAITKDKIKEDIVLEIMRVATLFNYNEEQMAMFASKNYDINAINHFDIDDIFYACKNALIMPLAKENNGYKVYDEDEMFAKKVNLLNDTSPVEYFRLKSNNTYPSPADINIINILSRDYGLSNGVINVIIDQTLASCNQDFPRAYCEKLASKLKRLKAANAMEAINALSKRKKKDIKEKIEEENIINNENDETISNDDIQKMFEDL